MRVESAVSSGGASDSGRSTGWHRLVIRLHHTMIPTPTLVAWPKVNGPDSPSLRLRLILKRMSDLSDHDKGMSASCRAVNDRDRSR